MVTPGLKTSCDHLLTICEVWVIVDHPGWIVRNRAMLHDVAAIEGASMTYWRLLVMFKSSRESCDISWRDATSRMFSSTCHIFTCARPICTFIVAMCIWINIYLSIYHDVVPWSYDVVRHRTRSHNHRPTIIVFRLQLLTVKSYNLVRLSYDGRTMSY